jgi:hypothetical protein
LLCSHFPDACNRLGKKTTTLVSGLNIDIQVERWPIERLIPRVNNPRTHRREQVARIAKLPADIGYYSVRPMRIHPRTEVMNAGVI